MEPVLMVQELASAAEEGPRRLFPYTFERAQPIPAARRASQPERLRVALQQPGRGGVARAT
eukprot:4486999-Alexandrium_andersonii.AAC.1